MQRGYLVINYTPAQSKPLTQLYHSCISNYGREKQLVPSVPVLWTDGDTGFLVHPDPFLAHQFTFSYPISHPLIPGFRDPVPVALPEVTCTMTVKASVAFT